MIAGVEHPLEFPDDSRQASPTAGRRGERRSLRLPVEGLKAGRRSGLVFADGAGDVPGEMPERSVGGRGDNGTFHRLASSGKSSSASLYSSSSSLIDFLLGCHEPRRIGAFLTAPETSGPCKVAGRCKGCRDADRGDGCDGDGERERLRLLMACCAKDGDEGLRCPLLKPFGPGTASGWRMPKPEGGLTGLCAFAYFGRCAAAVSSLVLITAAAFCLFALMLVAAGRGGGGFVVESKP